MGRFTKGFTLLELLIATTIMTMVALLGGIALRISLKTLNRGSVALGQYEKESFTLYKLTAQLISIRPYTYRAGRRSVLFFSGEEKAVEFISSSSLMAPGTPGLYRIRLLCKEDSLYQKEARLLDDESLTRELQGKEIELLKGVKNASLSYFDGVRKRWVAYWKKNYLPLAVKIEGEVKGQTWNLVVPVLSGHKWSFPGGAS